MIASSGPRVDLASEHSSVPIQLDDPERETRLSIDMRTRGVLSTVVTLQAASGAVKYKAVYDEGKLVSKINVKQLHELNKP
eukprot:873551-Rhodomonas_salina.2